MTVTIRFLTENFDGATAELYYHGFHPLPERMVTIDDGIATFAIQPAEPFFIRVTDNGRTLLRTGAQSSNTASQHSADFEASFTPMRILDPSATTLSLQTFESTLGLPVTNQGITLNSLALTSSEGELLATGVADIDIGFFGIIAVDYNFRFSLGVVTSATSDKVINIRSAGAKLRGRGRGLTGFIRNRLVSVGNTLFTARVSDAIEKTLQSRMDDAIDSAFGESGTLNKTMATLLSVDVSGNNLNIDPLISIPSAAAFCPLMIS